MPGPTCSQGHRLHDASSLRLEPLLASAVQLLKRRHGEEAGGMNLQVVIFCFIFATLFLNIFTLTLIDYVKLSTHLLSFSDNHTTSAVADTSKSLWVPQIILLEYLPVSTTCRSILRHRQTTARRSLESGDKFPAAGIPTGRQEGPSRLPPVKPVVNWDLALIVQC